jgi:hypothetical protein
VPTLDELDRHPFEVVGPPTDLSPDGLRDWIEKTCAYLSVTPTELSRSANMAPSTVNKFMLDIGGKKSLSSRTIARLVEGAAKLNSRKFGTKYLHSDLPTADPAGFTSRPIRVAGALRAGIFKSEHVWPIQSQFFVSVPIPNVLSTGFADGFMARTIAMVVADNHAEGIFPYASVVVARKFGQHEPAETGDFYIVSRKNEANQVELTIRHFIISPQGDMWLIAQGRTPRQPDIYLGRTALPEGLAAAVNQKFPIDQHQDYTIEYKVISAIQPFLSAFEKLKFPD